MREVKLRVPEGLSDSDLKEMLIKGVPPELTALLDSVRGLLGALDQSIRTMAESNRMASERQAQAILESSTTLDTSDVGRHIEALTQQVSKSNRSIEKSVDRIATVIAETMRNVQPTDNTQSIVEALAPLVSQSEGPRRFHIDLHRNEDDFLTSLDGVTEDVRH